MKATENAKRTFSPMPNDGGCFGSYRHRGGVHVMMLYIRFHTVRSAFFAEDEDPVSSIEDSWSMGCEEGVMSSLASLCWGMGSMACIPFVLPLYRPHIVRLDTAKSPIKSAKEAEQVGSAGLGW